MIGKTQRMNTNKCFEEYLYEEMAILNHKKGKDAFGRNNKKVGDKYVKDRQI